MTRPAPDGATVPPAVVEEIRRSRRHPRVTQFDYLHVKRLVDDLAEASAASRGSRATCPMSTAAIDRRFVHGPLRLPMNLVLSARCSVERGS
jgi:hypothetical protein